MAIGNKVIIKAAIEALRKERERAEPVAYIIQDAEARDRGLPGFLSYDASINDEDINDEDINEYEISVTPLYTAPPAPVVPDEWRSVLQEMVNAMLAYEMDVGEPAPYKHRKMMMRAGHLLESRRTAMLNHK